MKFNTKIKQYNGPDGQSYTYIRLANRAGWAKLNTEDFDHLRAAGITDCWYLNAAGPASGSKKAYVKCMTPYGSWVVARLILEAPPHYQVRYRDNDCRNLRRSNLMLMRGGRAIVDAGQVLDESAAALAEGELL